MNIDYEDEGYGEDVPLVNQSDRERATRDAIKNTRSLKLRQRKDAFSREVAQLPVSWYRAGTFFLLAGLVAAGVSATLILSGLSIIAVPFAVKLFTAYHITQAIQLATGATMGALGLFSFIASGKCYAHGHQLKREAMSFDDIERLDSWLDLGGRAR